MNHLNSKQVYPVMPVPLHEDESIDFSGLKACVEFYESSGVAGITVLGSGGELPYFSDAEQLSIVKFVADIKQEKTKLVVGLNAYSSSHAIEKLEKISDIKCDILLMLSDYYLASFSDYKAAYKKIAGHSAQSILFYYFPQITNQYLSSNHIVSILNLENVIGIKDSSLNLKLAKQVLSELPETKYLTGLSLLLEPLLKIGGAGAICPIAAVAPKEVQLYLDQLIKQDKVGSTISVQKIRHLLPVVNNINAPFKQQAVLLGIATKAFPFLIKKALSPHANTKEALRLLGLPIGITVRSPLPAFKKQASEKIQECLKLFV